MPVRVIERKFNVNLMGNSAIERQGQEVHDPYAYRSAPPSLMPLTFNFTRNDTRPIKFQYNTF